MTERYNETLQIALETYAQESLFHLPDERDLAARQSFSARFERRMQRLIRKARKLEAARQTSGPLQPVRLTERRHKRLLAAAIVLAMLVSLLSVSAARDAVFKFFVRVYETFSTIIFDQDQTGTDPDGTPSGQSDDIRSKVPAYIPDGYQLSDQILSDQLLHQTYTDSSGDVLLYVCQVIDLTQMLIDTEDTASEEIQIGNRLGIYYFNKGYHNLIWQDGPYVVHIISTLDKDVLIKMAESTDQAKK